LQLSSQTDAMSLLESKMCWLLTVAWVRKRLPLIPARDPASVNRFIQWNRITLLSSAAVVPQSKPKSARLPSRVQMVRRRLWHTRLPLSVVVTQASVKTNHKLRHKPGLDHDFLFYILLISRTHPLIIYQELLISHHLEWAALNVSVIGGWLVYCVLIKMVLYFHLVSIFIFISRNKSLHFSYRVLLRHNPDIQKTFITNLVYQ